MRYTTVILLASAGFAAAQTSSAPASESTSSSSSCDAQLILDTCLDTTQAQAETCEPNEWECLCSNYENILTCYNNCPDDAGRFAVEQQRTSYCNAAEAANPSSTSTGTATATASSESETAEATEEATATEESSETSTETGASESSTATGAASPLVVPASGLLAVLFGIVGML